MSNDDVGPASTAGQYGLFFKCGTATYHFGGCTDVGTDGLRTHGAHQFSQFEWKM